mmetsp:Transcript_155559/g.270650  ORF Transcript_155559/g.270650 Transcript_155559/m.270650 type:complete len:153 (-) Transcript_155559:87-545(-)
MRFPQACLSLSLLLATASSVEDEFDSDEELEELEEEPSDKQEFHTHGDDDDTDSWTTDCLPAVERVEQTNGLFDHRPLSEEQISAIALAVKEQTSDLLPLDTDVPPKSSTFVSRFKNELWKVQKNEKSVYGAHDVCAFVRRHFGLGDHKSEL